MSDLYYFTYDVVLFQIPSILAGVLFLSALVGLFVTWIKEIGS